MTREADLSRFYDALDDIREHVGGFRFLRDCTGRLTLYCSYALPHGDYVGAH